MELDEEMKEITRTSKQVEQRSEKLGLREGISAGRDSNFQESFDKGFEEGFKNAFLLGQCKGILVAASKQNDTPDENVEKILTNISGGACEMCKTIEQTKDEDDIDKLIETQNKTYETNFQVLKTHFKDESLTLNN